MIRVFEQLDSRAFPRRVVHGFVGNYFRVQIRVGTRIFASIDDSRVLESKHRRVHVQGVSWVDGRM